MDRLCELAADSVDAAASRLSAGGYLPQLPAPSSGPWQPASWTQAVSGGTALRAAAMDWMQNWSGLPWGDSHGR